MVLGYIIYINGARTICGMVIVNDVPACIIERAASSVGVLSCSERHRQQIRQSIVQRGTEMEWKAVGVER
jgi:hypothetical protein